jgi:hypothetical protein
MLIDDWGGSSYVVVDKTRQWYMEMDYEYEGLS